MGGSYNLLFGVSPGLAAGLCCPTVDKASYLDRSRNVPWEGASGLSQALRRRQRECRGDHTMFVIFHPEPNQTRHPLP